MPKVIDFGIAKATSHRLTEKTLHTAFREFVGTPEYMSPDQARDQWRRMSTHGPISTHWVCCYTNC